MAKMILRFDHVNIRTANLEAMVRFYTEVLGLRRGERPPFSFGGAWLYCGEQPVVHLVEVGSQPAPEGELRLEHFAFAAEDLAGFVNKLAAAGLDYRLAVLPGSGTRQVNVRDPDGNRLHVDFGASEPLP